MKPREILVREQEHNKGGDKEFGRRSVPQMTTNSTQPLRGTIRARASLRCSYIFVRTITVEQIVWTLPLGSSLAKRFASQRRALIDHNPLVAAYLAESDCMPHPMPPEVSIPPSSTNYVWSTLARTFIFAYGRACIDDSRL